MTDVRFGRRTVHVSNEEKLFWPDDGITKGDLVAYYGDVGGVMLAHIKGHPLSVKRFPDGIGGQSFFMKNTPDYFPRWINRVGVAKKGGSLDQVIVCDSGATLAYIANQGGIEMHVSLSRADEIDRPDRMIFDLDPSSSDFGVVKSGARAVREVLEELELPCVLQTSGSKGLHVVTPLRRNQSFDEVRAFARDVALVVSRRAPDDFTIEMRKEKRKGRLLIDYFRNAYAQTAVAPYSVRALPGAPVATPIGWEELQARGLHARRYNLKNVRERLGERGDVWKGMSRHARGLSGARKELDRLLDATEGRGKS